MSKYYPAKVVWQTHLNFKYSFGNNKCDCSYNSAYYDKENLPSKRKIYSYCFFSFFHLLDSSSLFVYLRISIFTEIEFHLLFSISLFVATFNFSMSCNDLHIRKVKIGRMRILQPCYFI